MILSLYFSAIQNLFKKKCFRIQKAIIKLSRTYIILNKSLYSLNKSLNSAGRDVILLPEQQSSVAQSEEEDFRKERTEGKEEGSGSVEADV